MVTSADIEDIISKLVSDKVKSRDTGLKLLNTWLEGEESTSFCIFLSKKTAQLKPDEPPHVETWPCLVRVLTDCISKEISTSKKQPPKLLLAKNLRLVIQKAEDAKFSGKRLFLLPVIKSLFNHIWKVLKELPSFHSEYEIILRHLLAIKDYRFQMRRQVYCGLVLLHLEKVKTSLIEKTNAVTNSKEELFRCILTLHSLLENPPGDLPDNLRENIVDSFVGIFSYIRDEGKISRKLIECVNTYLLKDGPNLDCQSMKIHSAVEEFIFRYWFITHDRGLKDALVLYARLQLKLMRSVADGIHLVEKLLDVVSKELDQNNMASTSMLWGDATKDDKLGVLMSSRYGLMELAAAVFYWACNSTAKTQFSEKRSRRENAAYRLREGLMKGKWLWNSAFCFLIHNYNCRIRKDLLVYWFEGICENFERILNEGNSEHAYDGLLWVLRSLQELASMRLVPLSGVNTSSKCFSLTKNELCSSWHTIWSSLIHALPIFSNVNEVADAALMLLGNVMSNELIRVPVVPQDIWDLRLFKNMPSMSALYFTTCYFTRKDSQGDLRNILHLRQSLLRAALGLLNWKESIALNENVITFLPAAIFSLCVGCAPLPQCLKGFSFWKSYVGISEAVEDRNKTDEHDHELVREFFECSVEVIAEIEPSLRIKESQSQSHHLVRLPGQIWRPLLKEIEGYFRLALMDEEVENVLLSDLLFRCGLVCNCIYYSIFTRLREESSSFVAELCRYLIKLLQRACYVVEENQNHFQTHGYVGSNPFLDETGSIVASVRCFVHSPLFSIFGDQNAIKDVLSKDIIDVTERLLRTLAKIYEECSCGTHSIQPEIVMSGSISSASDGGKARIVDIELDVNEDSNDMDVLAISGTASRGMPYSSVKWKFDMISVIASFFAVLPCHTWEVMLDLMEKECDLMVCGNILSSLCGNFSWFSSSKLSDLVSSMNSLMEKRSLCKLRCVDILSSIRGLLKTLISSYYNGKDNTRNQPAQGTASEQRLSSLGDLVHRISETDVLDWGGRIAMIDCICNFIILDPHNGQGMVGRLLPMLQDADFRVRLFLAKRMGILFQTWDGHEELFQDICSDFGVKLVTSSKKKIVKASDVLAAGFQPRPTVETIVVTLAHLAFYSEAIELEAIFMICVVAAMYPCQRELVSSVLDNLSRQLKYMTRLEYLEELIGMILFSWDACSVSLAALIEIRDLFVPKSEPNYFAQYCCPWLLPALMLSGNTTNLKWIASVAGQPLTVLVKEQFVPIFAICMVLHSSKKSGRENGVLVLQDSLLRIGEISENERDLLIKKHMVSIVSSILSLSSSALDPPVPFFSKDIIILAIQTVVDGFLEMDGHPTKIGVVDKINIFRADRVFMFLVEMHYKVTAAAHHRHKCHRLSGIEVLVNIIGHRAAIASTSNYLSNLVGQFIGCQALQGQCCLILSKLLEAFKNNPSKDITRVLGEQLQFLVSKLVACYIPTDDDGKELCVIPSPQVTSLLHQLTVDSDPTLFCYIKELEPFPEIDCFDRVRSFHQELGKAYSSRDHFLKFVRRASHLPQRLVLWSLQTLHRKLLQGEIIQPEINTENATGQFNSWRCEPEIVSAVWRLVSICGSNDASNIRALVADFISRVGIGDPHCVVFHLPGECSQMSLLQPVGHGGSQEINSYTDTSIPEELLLTIIKVLRKYLMDDSVKILDTTSRALQGILSTEMGQKALLSFEPYERSLIGVHAKGVNMELVEKLLSHAGRKSSAEATSIENSSLWKTHGKTFETWICSLVFSLIEYSNNIIIRLCQDIVFLKAEVAELLFPNILANLAGRNDLNVDLCKIISSQVQETIFTESNELTKSIQVTLSALNELRLYHVTERASMSSTSLKRESSKYDKPSSYNSRSRSSSEKSKRPLATSSAFLMSTAGWEKVYWLAIDYLLVAKAAVQCGSYFTSILYVEHWCEEQFKNLTLGCPDFSPLDVLPPHIEILISAVTHINEPDSLYGIIQSHKLTSQIITYEHEGNWSKALEYYDLQVRSVTKAHMGGQHSNLSQEQSPESRHISLLKSVDDVKHWKSYKGLMRSLQQTGCTHVLDWYCQGLTSQKGSFQHDSEFTELQYEAAWRAGNWDFSLLSAEIESLSSGADVKSNHFNENLHSCLRALQEGDSDEFLMKLMDSKQDLMLSIHHASKESTEYIYSSIIRLQILDHLGMAWDLRWKPSPSENRLYLDRPKADLKPTIPTSDQLEWLNMDWSSILRQTQLHMNFLEPFLAFRGVLLQILSCKDCIMQHLLESASTLRKGSRFSLAAAALHELKFLSAQAERQEPTSYMYCLGRVEEAKLLRAQGQHEMAINLATYLLNNYQLDREASTVHRLVGKWLAETRSSNSRTILDKYLKHAVNLAEDNKIVNEKGMGRQCQTHFHLAHYADALFRSYEERLNSSEWQAAMRLRKHKTKELEALIRRLKGSKKGDKTDYSVKIQELQKQLSMDKEEAERLQDDKNNFLSLALEGYQRCLIIGDKYDVRVVFRLVSLWFSLSSRQDVINGMLSTVKEVQSYKFVPLVYQIASRIGNSKDGHGSHTFQYALVSLVKKMAVDHPYHTVLQLLALANGDRVKDKQRSRSSFVVDMDKKLAAENLLRELSSQHGAIMRQMKQMVEIYIKLAELETKREDTNRRIPLPREIRSLRELELVPVVTATFPVDRSCQYHEGSFPHFKGLADSIMVMNGINAPKVVECLGSDGHKYRQLAKSGNDDLRQDAVMEQFFDLVSTFLKNNCDTRKRRIGIRTYKVVPFTPSAGVLEWVDGTIPLGEYLLGSMRNGGAHGRYGIGDWSFLDCRQYMTNEKNKSKAFQKVCEKFRPVMHNFFIEKFHQPADWFERRLSYTRSVAASSMVGYIVGLGDRHSMNILIDQATAEVVHIDLGVAFEQGLMLKTPERVPFRLTRDIIDGMGVTGVDGVFRRCCEETLSVMRTNKEALLTIIEVFIHDPLYKWALSPLKALQIQKEPDDDIVATLEDSQDVYEGNKDAARALMRVKQKLDGYEDGEMRSVHGQVQQLIQDAIDPDRLCQMFPGWGAWL